MCPYFTIYYTYMTNVFQFFNDKPTHKALDHKAYNRNICTKCHALALNTKNCGWGKEKEM